MCLISRHVNTKKLRFAFAASAYFNNFDMIFKVNASIKHRNKRVFNKSSFWFYCLGLYF